MPTSESGRPSPLLLDFQFLLVSSGDIKWFKETHTVMATQAGFSRLALDWSSFPPIRIETRDTIAVLIANNAAVM